MEEESSVFDDIERVKKSKALQILRSVLIVVLFILAICFGAVSYYYFDVTARMPNIREVYNDSMINKYTIGFLIMFFSALLTILTGLFFVIRKKWRTVLVVLFAGNVMTWILSLYI